MALAAAGGGTAASKVMDFFLPLAEGMTGTSRPSGSFSEGPGGAVVPGTTAGSGVAGSGVGVGDAVGAGVAAARGGPVGVTKWAAIKLAKKHGVPALMALYAYGQHQDFDAEASAQAAYQNQIDAMSRQVSQAEQDLIVAKREGPPERVAAAEQTLAEQRAAFNEFMDHVQAKTADYKAFLDELKQARKDALKRPSDLANEVGSRRVQERLQRELFLRTDPAKGPFGRALGGPVGGGQPYMVGEGGPELFVPSGAGGMIVPGTTAGGGGHVGRGGYLAAPGGRAATGNMDVQHFDRSIGKVSRELDMVSLALVRFGMVIDEVTGKLKGIVGGGGGGGGGGGDGGYPGAGSGPVRSVVRRKLAWVLAASLQAPLPSARLRRCSIAIAQAEGTAGRGDYETVLGYGKYGSPDKPLTEMTVAEAYKFGQEVIRPAHRADQGGPGSSAIGRYQIVGKTMRRAAAALGIDMNKTKFDKATQDRMAAWIAQDEGLTAWEGFKHNRGQLAAAQSAISAGALTGGGTYEKPAAGARGEGGGAFTKTGNYKEGVDPRLTAILEQAALKSGLQVEAYSGKNPRSKTKQHPAGLATDIRIMDPKTGEPLGGDYSPDMRPDLFNAYEDYAKNVHQEAMLQDPSGKLADDLRWGGYFVQGTPMDLMHFDVTGGDTRAGNLETGLDPAYAKAWGIPGRQGGGPLGGGMLSLVGERGPELFRPHGSGGMIGAAPPSLRNTGRRRRSTNVVEQINHPSRDPYFKYEDAGSLPPSSTYRGTGLFSGWRAKPRQPYYGDWESPLVNDWNMRDVVDRSP